MGLTGLILVPSSRIMNGLESGDWCCNGWFVYRVEERWLSLSIVVDIEFVSHDMQLEKHVFFSWTLHTWAGYICSMYAARQTLSL